MPLRRCMEEHTHREYLTWMVWLKEERQTPKLTDYYLMQLAAEVRRVLSKKPNSIKMEHFELKSSTEKESLEQNKLAADMAKTRWLTSVGVGRKNG